MALFGSLFAKKKAVPLYVLMDGSSKLLGKARLKSASGDGELTLELVEGDEGALYDARAVQVVPQDKSASVQMCRPVRIRGGVVTLVPMRELDSEVRRNFRVPVEFESFAYPSRWTRTPITSVDLSCGGLAFTSAYPFAPGDRMQVVIPVTLEAPLLLTAQVLRTRADIGRTFCSCKFINMIDDEEAMLREAVFATQIGSARSGCG